VKEGAMEQGTKRKEKKREVKHGVTKWKVTTQK
jgi:hypothetical protein